MLSIDQGVLLTLLFFLIWGYDSEIVISAIVISPKITYFGPHINTCKTKKCGVIKLKEGMLPSSDFLQKNFL